MNNRIENLKKLFIYAGLEKEEYCGLQEDIDKKNKRMLLLGTEVAIILFLVMFLVSCGSFIMPGNHMLYAVMMLVLIVVFGLEHAFFIRRPRLLIPGMYLFLLILYGYSILQSAMVQPEIPSTSFCVVLFAVSFLFIDRPCRIALFLIVAAALFCVVASYCKPAEIAGIDIVNAICYLCLAIICNTYLIHIKIRSLLHTKKAQAEIDTDGLTRLLVKKAAERDIRKYIGMTREPGTLIMIDLDNFKQVNDTKGHAYGDVVLKLTGDCIRQAFRAGDIKGRFGGDEFIVFLPGMSSRRVIMERLERFRALMNQGVAGSENRSGIHQSIGVAMYPEDGEDFASLFEKADEALYESKRRGKNQYCFYTSVKIGKRIPAAEN